MMLMALSEHAVPAAGGGHGQLDFMGALFVFMLATFIGVMVIQRVSRLLHTPLMSLTNAISSVIIVGAILAAGPYDVDAGSLLGALAVGLAAVNVFGGFLVTQRMLEMFKKKPASRDSAKGEGK